MDTFPDTPLPEVPDEEFDAFLTELNSAPTATFDYEAYNQAVIARIEAAKAEAGYTALYEDVERTELTRRVFLDEFKDADPNSFDTPEELAKIALAMLNSKEIVALAKIQMTIGFSELRLLDHEYSAEIEFKEKAELYASLLIVSQISADDPILTVLNKVIPGPVLAPDHFKLQPYLLDAMETMANSALQDKEIEEFSLEVFKYVGIDPKNNTIENNMLKYEATSIAIFGNMPMGEPNARANRLERINEMAANSKHLTPEIVQKLIQFIEERYPIQ